MSGLRKGNTDYYRSDYYLGGRFFLARESRETRGNKSFCTFFYIIYRGIFCSST